jgi:hypothetical protein
MSVLAREADAYQRALDAWQRQANSHNRKVSQYRDSLVRDDQNRQLVQFAGQVYAVNPETGRLEGATAPASGYGLTDMPNNPGILELRQNPIGTRQETVKGAQRYQDPAMGEDYYFTSTYETGEGGVGRTRLGPEWGAQSEQPGVYRSADDYGPPTYTLEREVGVYGEAPGAIEGFNRPAPSATLAQARSARSPSLAQVEGGLIANVIRGRGVKQGVPVYRPRSDR